MEDLIDNSPSDDGNVFKIQASSKHTGLLCIPLLNIFVPNSDDAWK